VASRAPRTGARLVEERKRKAVAPGRPTKRRKGASGLAAAAESYLIEEGEDNKEQSDLVFMYNMVRGYMSAIKELWAHQTSCGLHNAPQPKRVVLKALETSII
jgi:hypothetical protein